MFEVSFLCALRAENLFCQFFGQTFTRFQSTLDGDLPAYLDAKVAFTFTSTELTSLQLGLASILGSAFVLNRTLRVTIANKR
jgi:hypothetical protein